MAKRTANLPYRRSQQWGILGVLLFLLASIVVHYLVSVSLPNKLSLGYDRFPVEGTAAYNAAKLLIPADVESAFDVAGNGGVPSDVSSGHRFSIAGARGALKGLTSLGPRVTGSITTEIDTPNFLLQRIASIEAGIRKAGIPSSEFFLEVDVQRATGEFHIDFLGGITNVYKNVTNVVARLSWPSHQQNNIENGRQFPHTATAEAALAAGATTRPGGNGTILINAHFDSVPGSPGAADDGIGVAVMLEMIRSLAYGAPLDAPVIMLFNGAEEWNHQAAHGFITKHPWSNDVSYILNLEAIGSGGRELVFQCNSGLISSIYGKSVPYPQTSVIAHELFKNFLYVAASTDWSTILKFGPAGMRGMDTAYVSNGYVYHTTFDREDIVKDGTLLNTGENILHMTRALGDWDLEVPYLHDDNNDSSAVFFDLLYTFYISYSGIYVTLIHGAIIIAAIYTTKRLCELTSCGPQLWTGVKDELKANGVTVLTNIVVGTVAFFFFPMRWYDGGMPIALLLFLPAAILSTLYYRGEQLASRPLSNEYVRMLAPMQIWLFVAILCWIGRVMSGYLACSWLLSISLSSWVYYFGKRRQLTGDKPCGVGYTGGWWNPDRLYLITLIPQLFITHRLFDATLLMMIPLFGKSGTVVPVEILLGSTMGIFLATPLGSLFAVALRGPLDREKCFNAAKVIGVTFLAIMFLLKPYSAMHPKRLWVQHIERIYRRNGLPATGAISDMSPYRPNFLTNTHSKSQDSNQDSDYGLWVSGFDEQGLNPLHAHLSIDRTQHNANLRRYTDCVWGTGDCYFQFPWYFPVADVLRDAYYFPTDSRPIIPEEERLSLALHSIPISKDADQLRLVRVDIRGPSHVHFVLRDHARGERIKAWLISEVVVDSIAAVLRNLSPPSPVRDEGIHFMEVGFGLCQKTNQCEKSLFLLVSGNEEIEVVVYGHYVDNTSDPTITHFIENLPEWSRGSEWTKFPSMLISDTV